MAMAQICAHYRRETRNCPKVNPHPILKFFDVKHILREIDNEDRCHNEAHIEERVSWLSGEATSVIQPAEVLMMNNEEDELNLHSREVKDLLLGKPPKVEEAKMAELAEKGETMTGNDIEEDSGLYSLGAWQSYLFVTLPESSKAIYLSLLLISHFSPLHLSSSLKHYLKRRIKHGKWVLPSSFITCCYPKLEGKGF
ncbi:hypothetical protein BDQ17DRAFT_1330445 [Cyathus striatus]|nr:hypothetical protein BDQ17DRAFT_1330445 [Cyathus striatus]